MSITERINELGIESAEYARNLADTIEQVREDAEKEATDLRNKWDDHIAHLQNFASNQVADVRTAADQRVEHLTAMLEKYTGDNVVPITEEKAA